MRPQVNATGEGLLNPHDPYWGRGPNAGAAGGARGNLGGISSTTGGNIQRNEVGIQYYARLQALRDAEIKRLQGKVFGGNVQQTGGVLYPADMLEVNATTKFQTQQTQSLMNQLNVEMYGAKPDPFGAFSRTIQAVNSFSYEPRNAFTFSPKTAFQ